MTDAADPIFRNPSGQPAPRHSPGTPDLPPRRRSDPDSCPQPDGDGIANRCPPPEFDRDLRTRAVTTGIAQRLLDVTGEAPSVVIAEYDREYIDANRSAKCAFEASDEQPPEAQQYYDEYHNTIREFIDDIRAENGGLGLLFDIHGTKGIQGNLAHLYLGTVNGCTVKRLMRADPQALQRRRSLRGFLEAAGYDVVAEAPQLIGGHTVRTYGSHNPNGLDAI